MVADDAAAAGVLPDVFFFVEAAVDAAAWREAALSTVLYLPLFVFALRYLGSWRDVLYRSQPASAL